MRKPEPAQRLARRVASERSRSRRQARPGGLPDSRKRAARPGRCLGKFQDPAEIVIRALPIDGLAAFYPDPAKGCRFDPHRPQIFIAY